MICHRGLKIVVPVCLTIVAILSLAGKATASGWESSCRKELVDNKAKCYLILKTDDFEFSFDSEIVMLMSFGEGKRSFELAAFVYTFEFSVDGQRTASINVFRQDWCEEVKGFTGEYYDFFCEIDATEIDLTEIDATRLIDKLVPAFLAGLEGEISVRALLVDGVQVEMLHHRFSLIGFTKAFRGMEDKAAEAVRRYRQDP